MTKMNYMRKSLILMIYLLLSCHITAQAQAKAEVSETVELVSVIARLAGLEEYSTTYGGSYVEDINNWFSNYKNHEAVIYQQELRSKYIIAYDAVASMGVHLVVDNGLVKFGYEKEFLESRWQEVDLNTYLSKLNKFYSDTHFHEFFTSHKDYYETALSAYDRNVLPYFHQDWYEKFYGTESNEYYRVIIGFGNGGENYGCKRKLDNNKCDVFNISCYFESDKYYSNGWNYASLLVHEFNHSFVNPLIENSDSNYALVKDASDWMFEFSKWAMSLAQAYNNSRTVMNESVVRAAVLVYLQENGFTMDQIKTQMYEEISRGFTWTPELFNALQYYSSHRDQYGTLNDYYPEIAKCLDKYVAKERERIDQSIGLRTFEIEKDNVKMTFTSNSPTTLQLESATLTKEGHVDIPGEVNGIKVTAIGNEVFYRNKLLTSITIPESIESIGDFAFDACNISKIELPSSLKKIGKYAFSGTNIETIIIPTSVTSIKTPFICNCSYLTKVIVEDGNSFFDSRDNCNAVIETLTNTLIAGCRTTVIPKGVIAFGDNAFRECQYLEEYTIPEWITSIGIYAFMHCSFLTKLYSYIRQPFKVAPTTFENVPTSSATLYVPKGTKEVYQSTEGWNVFKNILEIENSDVKGISMGRQHFTSIYKLNGQKSEDATKYSGVLIRNKKKYIVK